MGRAPCCDKANVKKGPWSPEEDAKLKDYIQKFGTGGNWIALPQKVGLKRCGKSCRLRWLNYLRPNIKHGEFSAEEDRIICTLFANIGSRWSIIAAQLPGRTDNDIKNYWNTKLKKKLISFVSHNNRNNNININTSSPLQYNNNNNHNINSIIPQRKFMINPQFQNSPSSHETNSNIINTTSSLSHLNIPPSSFYQNTPTTTTTPMLMMMNNTTTFDSTNSSSSISSYNNNNNNNNNLINFQGHNGQDDHNFVGGVLNYDNNNNQCNYYHMIKDNISSNINNNVVMFGSGSNNEASCSTSSDGSCNYQIKQELEMGFHGQSQTSFVGLLNNINNNNYDGNNYNINNNNNLMWGQKPISGYLDDNYYQVSDVKQVISATTTSCSNANNSFFNVDENKTQENINNFNSKVMYF